MKHYRRVMTIAGSDPSGGAGIQADLKTFSACGCYGMSAITAVVDENTVNVRGVHPIPETFVAGQISSVLDDIGADAVKLVNDIFEISYACLFEIRPERQKHLSVRQREHSCLYPRGDSRASVRPNRLRPNKP